MTMEWIFLYMHLLNFYLFSEFLLQAQKEVSIKSPLTWIPRLCERRSAASQIRWLSASIVSVGSELKPVWDYAFSSCRSSSPSPCDSEQPVISSSTHINFGKLEIPSHPNHLQKRWVLFWQSSERNLLCWRIGCLFCVRDCRTKRAAAL